MTASEGVNNMPTPGEIREDVDQVIGLITEIVEIAQGGDKLAVAVKIATSVPELLLLGTAFQAATLAEKTDYALEGFDALIGSDETALIAAIGPLGPDTVEVISDAMKEGLREVFEAKFAEPVL